jgi:hypothetical protein
MIGIGIYIFLGILVTIVLGITYIVHYLNEDDI